MKIRDCHLSELPRGRLVVNRFNVPSTESSEDIQVRSTGLAPQSFCASKHKVQSDEVRQLKEEMRQKERTFDAERENLYANLISGQTGRPRTLIGTPKSASVAFLPIMPTVTVFCLVQQSLVGGNMAER